MHTITFANRFRKFLPVVIDVETAGFNPKTDALLEIAAVFLAFNESGEMVPIENIHFHVQPFQGANLEPAALEFLKIDPYHPFRFAVDEEKALSETFTRIRHYMKQENCQRAILVGHNPMFDMEFIKAAVDRSGLKRNPFHPFTTFDTATLGGLAYGQTVLARALREAGIPHDTHEAHSAIYDATQTAKLFCLIVNKWQEMGGWPLEE
jgi:ribonuclease T